MICLFRLARPSVAQGARSACAYPPWQTARMLSRTPSYWKKAEQDALPSDDKKAPRTKGQNSLRRVSLEAERSRIVVKGRGKHQFVDPELETKKVAAYCAAEQYDIHTCARLLRADGHTLDPHGTGLYPQVIHIQPTTEPTDDAGDIFIFPSGTVVAWNVPDRTALRLVERVLPPAAINSAPGFVEVEKEDLAFISDPSSARSTIVGDTIILGTAPSGLRDGPSATETDAVFAKIAFSSGLARSTKLAVLERLLDTYFHSTRGIPTALSRGSRLPFAHNPVLRRVAEVLGLGARLPFTRPFILRKTGELLSIRAQLNLYSELTDSLPDLFWDAKHELGLEDYYDVVGRALDVGVRIKGLNEKMDYAQEIAAVMRETLSERHNLRLEWGIIILIFIEVMFEIRRLFKEYREAQDPDSVDELLKRYLRAQQEGR
ncbi:hypothetical protein EJ06DRAFT_530696 [Trichodelitschia bisporula]|uniref:DUF155 domain-containing protein n=1 Tax=Trichodelitschia bisporula TaxID=703511 RepID=A0A6G1HW04_9PEZI|nr:hypothetical protein EJ06DRAFT_530696 [Trichodelitschia bisporula]